MFEPFINYSQCRGIDNISDPARIPADRKGNYFLSEGMNIDIDDQGMVHRRDGFSTLVYPGNVHSFWSGESACLFMQSGSLCRLNSDFSSTVLLSGLDPNAVMQYVETAGTIYFTNNSIIGYVRSGSITLFPVISLAFKLVMPAGHLIEYYHNRLYVVRDKVLYFSDPLAKMQYDHRKNVRPFPSRPVMFQAVEDGIYVSDQEKIYFMGGPDPLEMTLSLKADYPVMESGFRKLMGENIGSEELEIEGPVILMATKNGFCLGGKGGSFKNITGKHFGIPLLRGSTTLFRDQPGMQQFIFLGKAEANQSILTFDPLSSLTMLITNINVGGLAFDLSTSLTMSIKENT